MPQRLVTDVVPRHEQISEAIRDKVRSGALPVGSKLPGETQLASEFGVARGTVRRALRTLNEQGILQSLHGKGTYVRSGHPEPSIAQTLVGLSESLSYSDKHLTTRVLSQTVVKSSELERSDFDLDTEEKILVLDRVRYLDGIPAARLKNWVRLDLCPGIISVDFEQTGLFAALDQHARLKPRSGRRTFEAVMAESDIAQSLHISHAVPLLFLKQETYLDDGTLVEFSDVWMDSKQVKVATNLTR